MSTPKTKLRKSDNLNKFEKTCMICNKSFMTYTDKMVACSARCKYIAFHTDKDIDKYDSAVLIYYRLYPDAYEINNYNTLLHIVESNGYEWINHQWVFNNKI